jgi:hypothetical protein
MIPVGLLWLELKDADNHRVAAPQIYGGRPAVGDVVEWDNKRFTVRKNPALWRRKIVHIDDATRTETAAWTLALTVTEVLPKEPKAAPKKEATK